MKSHAVVVALAVAVMTPNFASAQTDFLTIGKVVCTPVQTVECDAQGKCQGTPVSEKDKTELLVLDFATKKAALRTGGETKPFGEISEDKVEGGTRTFLIGEKGSTLKSALDRVGKLTLFIDGTKSLAEGACVAD